MRKSLGFVLATATLVPLLFVGSALASPSKSSLCSGCHSLDSKVSVTPTFRSCNGSTATYSVVVSNTYSGAEGWAVFDGGSNLQNALGASGTFSVASGKSYDVWGASKGGSDMGGSNHITISAQCDTGPGCTPTAGTETGSLCSDGVDNDCDGMTDAADPDCSSGGCTATAAVETGSLCRDRMDNDCDGMIDAADSGCHEDCTSAQDDDGDGKINCCDKRDCGKQPVCSNRLSYSCR